MNLNSCRLKRADERLLPKAQVRIPGRITNGAPCSRGSRCWERQVPTPRRLPRDLAGLSHGEKVRERRGRPRKYTPEEETQLGKLVLEDGIATHKAQAIVRPSEPIRAWPTKATITAVERERGRREERTRHEELQRRHESAWNLTKT